MDKNFDEALSNLSDAYTVAPHSMPAIEDKAQLLIKLKRHAQAVQEFARLIDIDEFNVGYHLSRAQEYLATTPPNTEMALKDYSEAIKLEPDDPVAFQRRAALYGKLHDEKSAAADLKRAKEIDDAHMYRAR